MTLACVRRPTCEARPAARKASPITYTPPWKYRTTWRGSIPSIVISAVGTPPSAAAVTVTSAGSGCAETNSRSSRRCSSTLLSTGKADCRRIASRVSRCSLLTDCLPSLSVVLDCAGSLEVFQQNRLDIEAELDLVAHDDAAPGDLVLPG